ncbi:MAG: hypothetical protein AB8H86_30590 [Polyangiales bacterium]
MRDSVPSSVRTLLLTLGLLLSCSTGSESIPPQEEAATSSDDQTRARPIRPIRAQSEPCEDLACSFGLRPDETLLGPELRRHGQWVELEGGVSYEARDGGVTRLQLRPCPPLRGDLAWLDRHGFSAEHARVRNLRDARGIEGIEGFWLEGRGASCVISQR